MRKDTPPPHNRHLQLVSNDGSVPTPASGVGWAGTDGPAPLLRQIAADSGRNYWGGWRVGMAVLGALVLVYGGLHLGAAHLRDPAGNAYDARRFSMAVSVRSPLEPETTSQLAAHSTVRTDDAWSFVLHNRSHQNAFFGLFAVSKQGQFFWFYPRDGGGVDLQTLPLPAIPTMTLPDGVVPDALGEGPLDVMAVFLPQPASLSELETDYTAGGVERLRQRHKADVQQLEVSVVRP